MNLVEEEMVADNALAVLSDEKAMQELAKDNKTLLQKIGAFFRNLANKLKAIKEKLSKSSIVYSEVNHDIEFLEQSAEKIKTMLDSVKETTSKQSDVKFSINTTKNMQWEEQVNAYFSKNGIGRNDTLVVSTTTPLYLKESGITDLPLAIPLRVLTKATNGKDVSHNLNKKDLLSLKADIQNADIVIDDTNRNSLVFVKIKNDKLKIVAAFAKNVNFDNDYVHKATSVHFRQDVKPMLEKSNASSTIYFKSKNEFDLLSRNAGTIPAAYNSKIKFIDESLSQSDDNVNKKFSKNTVLDMKYKLGTEREKEKIIQNLAMKWGAYSLDGKTPLKLYHGTKAFGFTEFDLDKMDDKRSIFLTDDITTAQTYSETYDVRKISEKNQIDLNKLSSEELINQIKEIKRYKNGEYYVKADFISMVNNEVELLKNELTREIENSNKHISILDARRVLRDTLEYCQKEGYEKTVDTDFLGFIKYLDDDKYKVARDVVLASEAQKFADNDIVNRSESMVFSRDRVISIVEEYMGKGNYALYAKLNNPFVIDTMGSDWRAIRYYEDISDEKKKLYPNGLWHVGDTREVTEYAYNQGYDGVVFKNIVDNGGNGEQSDGANNIVVVFDNKMVKSADTVTYDNDGKVIPPSERFTDKSDIRYSKDTNFTKALTGDEKKKYNNAIMTGNDNGLRISDNSILVECENKSEYQYKYVVYDEFEDGQRITDVYAIGKIDTNVEDNVPSQYHNIAEYINDLKELGYDNRKVYESLLRARIKDTSYLLAEYSNRTNRYNVIGRGSVKNGTNTFDKSIGRGSSREDTGRVSSDRGRFSKYSRNTRLNYDENFDDVNEAFEQALKVLQNIKGIDVSSRVVEEVGKAQKNIDKELDGYHAQKMRNSNSVNKVARNLKEEYASSMPTGKLTNMLADLYDYMANGDSTDMAYINSQSKVIANELINSSTSIAESDYKDIRKRITDKSYSLTPETKKSLTEANGSWREARQSFSSQLTLSIKLCKFLKKL